MPARIRYRDDQGRDRVIYVPLAGGDVGRRPNKHLIAVSDPSVATGHARFECRNGRWRVLDLASPGGTHINGQAITAAELTEATELRLGLLRVRFEPSPPLPLEPAPHAGLLFLDPHDRPQIVGLPPGGAYLGSWPGALLCTRSDDVSRLHAFICFERGAWRLFPGDESGLIGRELQARAGDGVPLIPGQELRCGALRSRFLLLPQPALPAPSSNQVLPGRCPPLPPKPFSYGIQMQEPPPLPVLSRLMPELPVAPPSSPPLSVREPDPDEGEDTSEANRATGALLLCVDSTGSTRTAPIRQRGLTLGRAPSCPVRTDDPQTSRRHARVQPKDDRFVILDLGSANGTHVNGARAHGPQRLSSGDLIRCGALRARFIAPGDELLPAQRDRFLPYSLVLELGRIGPVVRYWATDPRSGATFVLSALEPQQPDWPARLQAEAQLYRRSPFERPPRAPPMLTGSDGTPAWIAPLGTGVLLREQLVAHGRLTLAHTLSLGRRLVDELLELHAQSLSGHQLSPETLWLRTDPLAEHGERIEIRGRHRPGSVLPPSPYLAWEARDGQPCDAASDLCSIGLILREALTGQPPPDPSVPSSPSLLAVPPGPPGPPGPAGHGPLPPLLDDLLHELVHPEPTRRPTLPHLRRWLAELSDLLLATGSV